MIGLRDALGAERRQEEEVCRRKTAVAAAQKELEVHTKKLTELAKVSEDARLKCKAEADKKEADKKEEAEKKEAEKKEVVVKKEEEEFVIHVHDDTESDDQDDDVICMEKDIVFGQVVPRSLQQSASAAKSADGGSAVQQAISVDRADGGSAVQQAIPVDNNNQPPIQKGKLRALSTKDAGGVGAPNIFEANPDSTSAQVTAAADLLKRTKASIDGMKTFQNLILVRDMIACRLDKRFQTIRTKILEDGPDNNFWAPFLNVHFLTLTSINQAEKQGMYKYVNDTLSKNFPEEMEKFLKNKDATNARIALSRKRKKSDWPRT
ncbi:hypothetical protein T484DRAFT_2508624 [Baffinella frigidus]|nr:hypothetical protein T484DRAFT_2508624 [Cryptophyta sp. CCMP2293]